MKAILPVDLDAVSEGTTTRWLVGEPGSGESCSIRLFSPAALASDRAALQSFQTDRICVLLRGAAKAQIGTETFPVDVETLVHIPAGAPHAFSGIGQQPAVFLDLFAPGLPHGASAVEAPARKVADAAGRIRSALPQAYIGTTGFAYQPLINRKAGSEHLGVNIVRVQPGGTSPAMHIHAFDQYYFILEGEMRMVIGRHTFDVGANCLVSLPAGMVHKNWNASGGVERHVALLVPEPMPGEVLDYAVDIHEREADF